MHLVDTTMFFAAEGGGVRRYLLAKHAWLTAHSNIRHTILTAGHADAAARGGVSTVRSPPLFLASGYRFPIRLGRWRESIVALNPDLIEVGDPYGPAWAARRAGQRLGVPVVGFYHSDLARVIGSRFGQGAERMGTHYVRRLYADFDAVIAPSRLIRDRLRAHGIERVTRQPLGVDTQVFHPDKRDPGLRAELGLAADTRLLIFAGRFAREKNLPLLFETLRRLGHRYHLLLVGSGATLPSQSNVTVLPYRTDETELARLIASCDALVHAGLQETFGLVVLEAMACGLPVIAAQQGALAELIDDSYGVVVPTATSVMFAEAIVALYESDRAAMGARARTVAQTQYSWNAVMHALIGLYRQQLAQSISAPAETAYVCR